VKDKPYVVTQHGSSDPTVHDTGDVWPEDTFVLASRVDPSKLRPRFTESYHTCLVCKDTGFVGEPCNGIYGYRPCPQCVRGDKIHGGWWREMCDAKQGRRSTREDNRLLVDNEPREEF
jgi:hypothetical protein